jgi:MerR family transcriptional regulator/heat shock protein HspR
MNMDRILEDRGEKLFLISVVSEMLHVHPQTLRMYEREGFVKPRRLAGHRLYSQSDVERLGFVLSLTRELGVNKAGVDIILRMRRRLQNLQLEVEDMMSHLEAQTRHDFEEKIRRLFSEEMEDEE